MLVGGLKSHEGPPGTGAWQGQPRLHRGGGTWWHRTPSRGYGAVKPVMVQPSHVAAPDLPGESGSAEATRELSSLSGHVEVPDLEEHGEGPETMVPAVKPGPYATSPRRRGGD
jgi:hypothetical protein